MMFSNGWHVTQTRCIVASAASEKACSSSAVMSTTFLATIAGSTLTGDCDCARETLPPMAALRTTNDAGMIREWEFTRASSNCPSAIGNGPQEHAAAVDRDRLLCRPLGPHVEDVRHDARPGLQLAHQFRAEALVDALQQIQRDDSCGSQIRREQISRHEADTVGDTRGGGVLPRVLDKRRIHLDA